MLYPRTTDSGELISDRQMVGFREHLYSKHRMTVITGELTGETASTDLLFALDSLSQDPIKVIITSGGGVLDSAFLLYDAFNLVQSPVYTIGRYCCSAAALLLASGTRRFVFPHARVMLHLPSAQLAGDSRDLAIQNHEVQRYQDSIVGILQDHGVTRTKEELLEDIDREYWMGAEEAIEYGLADEIVTPEIMRGWLS